MLGLFLIRFIEQREYKFCGFQGLPLPTAKSPPASRAHLAVSMRLQLLVWWNSLRSGHAPVRQSFLPPVELLVRGIKQLLTPKSTA